MSRSSGPPPTPAVTSGRRWPRSGSRRCAPAPTRIEHDDASSTDVVTFIVASADGGTVPADVFVISDGTVCDFV